MAIYFGFAVILILIAGYIRSYMSDPIVWVLVG